MKNMGSKDRLIRMVIGIVLIVAAVILQLLTGGFWWIGLLGLVFVVTSSIAMCPMYLPFHISTIKKPE